MIKLAKSAGFCIGVEKAVSTVYNNIGKGKLYTYGPIIHNKEVCRDLERMGVIAIDSFDDIDGTVVIRSHGVPPSVYDTLMERNIHYIDCTCVFVKKIHEIAKIAYNNNLGVIIIGDKNHPEIIGINGWCNNKAVIINSEAECDDVPKLETGYVVVIQTTYKEEIANAYIDILKSKGHTLDIKNTICNATAIRQQEAYNLSKEVDIMVVIGDKSSSNTRKLYEICKKNCKMTYYIETINDLQLNICKTDVKIGITAGASTPLAIIKEVLDKMSDFAKEGMNDFEQMLDETFVALHNGLVVKGTVIRVGADETVSVNLGYKADGVIEKGEFSSDPTKKPSDSLKPGDEIEVFVVHVNDREGTVLLSAKRVELFKGMQEIEKAFEEKTPVTGVVTEIIRGGVIAVAKGAKIFIPASQLSNRFVEDLNEFKGQTITFEILELDKSKRRMIGGRKELQKREDEVRKSQVYATLNEGDIVSGVVRRLTDFGAFVDLGGVDGLIHVSELSWGRVKHAKDVLSEGETVEVSVLSIDKEKGKVSLSLKGVKANPWDNIETKYIVGEIYKGRVVRIVPFGAFIEMEEGVDGLVHISQISSKHIAKVEDALTVGDIIDVKVLEVVIDKKQISLSKKEADAPLEEETSPEEVLVEEVAPEEVSAEEVAPEEAPVVVEAEEAPLEAEVPAEDNTEE